MTMTLTTRDSVDSVRTVSVERRFPFRRLLMLKRPVFSYYQNDIDREMIATMEIVMGVRWQEFDDGGGI